MMYSRYAYIEIRKGSEINVRTYLAATCSLLVLCNVPEMHAVSNMPFQLIRQHTQHWKCHHTKQSQEYGKS
jgi:hypothetical protein